MASSIFQSVFRNRIKTRIGNRAQKISLLLLSKTFHKNKNNENQFGFDKTGGESDLIFRIFLDIDDNNVIVHNSDGL